MVSLSEAFARAVITGADLSGINRAKNRTYTLSDTPATNGEHVFVGGMRQQPVSDYTISTATITFLNAISNSQKIFIWYFK